MSRRALFLTTWLLAATALCGAQEADPAAQATRDLSTLKQAVESFQAQSGRLPTTLDELVAQPADLGGKWQGPYVAGGKLPLDPWGKPYSVKFEADGRVRLFTLGADGAEGGTGPAADLEQHVGTAAPAPAAQQSLALVATLAEAKVAVGQSAQVTVRLTNTGSAPLTLPQLAEDRQLVSFDVQLDDGPKVAFERITPLPYQPKLDWATGSLEPGKSWELVVPFPVLTTGKLTITAHYGRSAAPNLANRPSPVSAPPVVVEMVPTAEGADEARIKLVTNYGPIHLRLFPREALGTSLHFARLITQGGKVQGKGELRQPFYDGLTFHRVIRGFMIQGGCPLGNGLGDAGYSIPAEFAKPGADGQIPEKLRHVPGRLSMARSSHDDSAGSQFFICTATPTHLDGKYTCFGEVTRGLDVAMTIAEVDVAEGSKPKVDVTIESIRLDAAKSK